MPPFGRFEIVDELYHTPFGCVYSARIAGENGNGRRNDYVVKVYQPPELEADELPGPDKFGCEAFIERARLQKRLSDSQARHWAPIHDVSVCEGKPYYVTDYYPRTAQRLIAGRVMLGPAALHEIITSVASGLAELREACGRCHGGLKPSNVLIGGAGEVSGAKIVLTDPSAASPADKADDGGDLYALGTVLYQLVTHRPFRNTAWPIEDSPEWSRLGKCADRWRMLCTLLLNPDAKQRPGLQALEQSLAALAPGGFSVKRVAGVSLATARKAPLRKLAVAALFLIVLAGGAGALIGMKESACRARIRQARHQWLDALWRDKTTLARLQSLGGPVIEESDWETIRTSDAAPTLAVFSLAALHRAEAADDAVRRIRARVGDAYLKAAEPLRQLQQTYQAGGYQQASDYLNSVVATSPPDDAALIQAINARIELANRLRSTPLPAFNEQTAAALKRLQASGDPDLQAFAKAVSAAFPSTWELSEMRWTPVKGVDLDGLVKQLNVPGWPAEYDEASLNKDLKLDLERPQLAQIQLWLSKLPDYQRVGVAPDRMDKSGLKALLSATRDKTRQELALFPTQNAAALKALDTQSAQIEGQIALLAQRRFTRKVFDHEFASAVDSIKEQIQSLPGNYHSVEPTELAAWFKKLNERETQFSSKPARDRWKSWIGGRTLQQVDESWMRQTNAMATTLHALESQFVVPKDLDGDPWRGPVDAKANHELGAAIDSITAPAMQPSPNALSRADDEFRTWCECVRDLRKEHDELGKTTIIDSDALKRHDQLWSTEPRLSFWSNQATGGGPYAATMSDIASRLKAIGDVERQTPAQAMLTLQAPDTSNEVALVAWHRLADPKDSAFISGGQLTVERVRNWSKVLGTVAKAANQWGGNGGDNVQKQVAECARQLWLRAVAAANSTELLDASFQLTDRHQIDLASAGMKPDATWFNVWLYRATHPVTAADESLDMPTYRQLPPADRYALQSSAGGEDRVERFAVQRGLYLWPKDMAQRDQAWESAERRQLQTADASLDEGKAQLARNALTGIPGEKAAAKLAEIDALIKDRDQRQKTGLAEYLKGNLQAAKDDLQAAARGGNTTAMINLGGMYRDGHPPIFPKDLTVAIRWFDRAFNLGDAAGVVELARTYEAESNLQKADELLTQAAAARPPIANATLSPLMRNLAQAYGAGNPRKADWYRMAAERGDGQAIAWLDQQSRQKPKNPGDGGSSLIKKGVY